MYPFHISYSVTEKEPAMDVFSLPLAAAAAPNRGKTAQNREKGA